MHLFETAPQDDKHFSIFLGISIAYLLSKYTNGSLLTRFIFNALIIQLDQTAVREESRPLQTNESKTVKTDEELIKQVRSGDLDAYRFLVERHQHRVATTVKAMLGDGTEAEDVGQETFIRFYKSIDSFRGESSVSTYLHRIAVNLSLNELKRRKRFLSRFTRQEDHLAETSHIEDKGDELENKQLIQQALQRLKPDFRSVVVLRYIEGYSTKETADLLNIPLGTVLSRLSRAQNKLRDFLLPFVNDER